MITLGTVREATNTASITRFLEERILPGHDWHLVQVRRRGMRLEPPEAYWASYRVRLRRGPAPLPEENGGGETPDPVGESPAGVSEAADAGATIRPGEGGDNEPKAGPAAQTDGPVAGLAEAQADGSATAPAFDENDPDSRELRLVARAVFDPEVWASYSGWLRERYGEAPCDPLDGLGYPVLHDETQHAIWFYPVDPNLPGLLRAADPDHMKHRLREHKHDVLARPGRIRDLKATRVRYLPEIAAILRYDIECEPAGASRTIFGKVQHFHRAARAYRVLETMWEASRQSGGLLRMPQPLGHHHDLGLFLQSKVEGEAIGSDRTAPAFIPAAAAAGEALAVIHDIDTDLEGTDLSLESELGRLDNVLEQFKLVHPRAHLMLRDLLTRIRRRVEKTQDEHWVPTHGDLKYDQFLHADGEFSIIDFDYFGWAENSFDLGKFCAHLVPSQPKGWEDSYAAEEARRVFLDSYREHRPHATLQRFQVYESINLANRAMTLMWSQMQGWMGAAETMLTMSLERLNSPLP